MAASTFWLLNALNKSYSTQTTYPIRFVYNDQRLVPIKALPEEVLVNVTGKGWKLLRKSLKVEVQPAEIYIRTLPRNNYLLGSALRPSLVNAMDGLQLNFVVTDTLFFNFNAQVTKRIPLQLDPKQKLTDDRHALLRPVSITPDTIIFRGPSSMVDSLPDPFLLRLPIANLTEPTKLSVPIAYDNSSLIKANISEATVAVKVRPLQQREMLVSPELVNVPLKAEVTLRPQVVLIRYQTLEDSGAIINPNAFRTVIDFSKYNRQDSTVAPELVQKPAGARNISLWPERMKAILEK
ncbi:YbbR-like domain-containing protein [Pontibacter sp. HJ8]